MKVEKKGRVEILRLEKKRGPVPKRPGLIRKQKNLFWRLWYWLRSRVKIKPCGVRPITVTADQLRDKILETFGSHYRYHILLSDSVYICLDKAYAENLLRGNRVDELRYVKEFGDCDDFAEALVGSLTRDHWVFGYAIGELWFFTRRYGHAVNWFFDGAEIWLIEPQNDGIYKWEDILKYEDPEAVAFMVKA